MIKNIENSNETQNLELGISDVSHNFYGEIKVKDTIEWNGEYFSGYDEVGGFKNRKMSGVNKVIKIFKELELVWMELDNGKKFIIKDLKCPEFIDDSWKKL